MTWLTHSLLVFVGAGLGANGRYWLGRWLADRLGSGFPWGTLAANVTGSVIIGLFMGLALTEGWSVNARLLIAVGVLGGFTTFSSFSFETLAYAQQGAWGLAAGNVAANFAGSLVGCWLGLVGARLLTHGPV